MSKKRHLGILCSLKILDVSGEEEESHLPACVSHIPLQDGGVKKSFSFLSSPAWSIHPRGKGRVRVIHSPSKVRAGFHKGYPLRHKGPDSDGKYFKFPLVNKFGKH